MNRRERRNARVAHKKTIQETLLRSNNESERIASSMRCERSEPRTLFDKVFSKKSGGTPVKCQGIYDSVFCKG